MAFVLLAALFWLIGVLAAIEMATFSARPERMEQAVDAGDRRGTLVKMYQRTPANYLAALQLLATAANFIVGAMIGANVERPIREWFDQQFPGMSYRSEVSWALSVGTVTILAIILTNIVPKHIGFVRANEIALQTAVPMRIWMRIATPLTSLIQVASRGLAKLIRIAPDEKHRVTERDLDVLLAEGLRAGSLNPIEQGVMRRALKLAETPVATCMIPIERVKWIDSCWSIGEVLEFIRFHGRSNYPVARGSLSELEGVVRALEVFSKGSLNAALSAPVFVGPRDSLLTALERLRPMESRLLLVREGGELRAILTLNDVLEQLVGSIRDT